MPFAKPTYHKPDYVYQAEFLRLYDITYADTKDMMSGGQMNYEVDRHGRAWIPVKEGERLGIVRKDPPDLMPSAYKKKAPRTVPVGFISIKGRREKVREAAMVKRRETIQKNKLSSSLEIIKIVRSLKEERDQLRKQVEEFNNLMSELKKAI